MPHSNDGKLARALSPSSFSPSLKAILTYHVQFQDTVALSRALKKYCDMDYSFSSSREGRFLIDLSQALDAGDEHRYMDLCNHFDSMTLPPLPGWKKNMLVKGHLKIKGGEDDFS